NNNNYYYYNFEVSILCFKNETIGNTSLEADRKALPLTKSLKYISAYVIKHNENLDMDKLWASVFNEFKKSLKWKVTYLGSPKFRLNTEITLTKEHSLHVLRDDSIKDILDFIN
ncbi:hypothetical protein HMI55_005308, partial [Coelomomyces lativittatus]